MVNRRTMGAALELTDEKKAFIKGSANEAVSAPVSASQSRQEMTPDRKPVSSEEAPTVRPVRRSRSRRNARQESDRGAAPLGISNLLKPLTTRLQPSTAASLMRAVLEQKLRGLEPSTTQEIVEEAIQEWLRDYGYLE